MDTFLNRRQAMATMSGLTTITLTGCPQPNSGSTSKGLEGRGKLSEDDKFFIDALGNVLILGSAALTLTGVGAPIAVGMRFVGGVLKLILLYENNSEKLLERKLSQAELGRIRGKSNLAWKVINPNQKKGKQPDIVSFDAVVKSENHQVLKSGTSRLELE